MKDAEIQILRAFLYALYQQAEPLSTTVVQQTQAIAASLNERVVELRDLAIATPELELPYRTAYRWLNDHAAERGLGIKFPPAKADTVNMMGETPNTVRDVRPHLDEMQRILTVIDQKLGQAPRILKSPDPKNTAQEEFR
jgi:hypothetical protein